jgi:hypothetical protein
MPLPLGVFIPEDGVRRFLRKVDSIYPTDFWHDYYKH